MKKLLILITAALAAVSCFPDERDNFMVDDSFGINSQDVVQDASVHTGFVTLGVSKYGKGRSAASLSVNLDAAALAEYNSGHETSYKMVPENYLSLDNNRLSYSEKNAIHEVTVTWDATTLATFLGDNQDYVIPISIKTDDQTVKVSPGKGLVLVHLYKSSLTVAQRNVTKVIDRKKVEVDKDGKQPVLDETIVLDLKFDNPIKGVGVTIPLKVDNTLIPTFNTEKGEDYVAAPEGLITLENDCAVIGESKQSGNYKLKLHKGKLMEGGKLKAFPNYVIPLTIDKDRLSATRYGKEISLKGLGFDNLTTFICINYRELKPGIYISREWGKYSTEEASWNAYYKGTAGAERNVTMDDDNIYLAEFNSTKNLWAISIASEGNTAKKLPVGTVESAGFADIYLTCPRVIPNTDPDINGGKDILAVSNLSTDVLKMYFYMEGIDHDPSVVNFNIWMGRRLGDTFTFWGTAQSGMFFLKDFDSAGSVVTFKMENRFTGSNSVQGRFEMPTGGLASGAAAYWPYPEDKNKGLYGLRNSVGSYCVSLQGDSWTATGGNETTSTQFDETYQNNSFQYISYNDKRYVAYTSQIASDDGRLFVLEGEATDSWDAIVQTHKVIYQAVIQNDLESLGDDLEDVQPSPKSSSHSGMDLCARQVGDDVLIAVVKQNVGLSLFRMTVIE